MVIALGSLERAFVRRSGSKCEDRFRDGAMPPGGLAGVDIPAGSGDRQGS